MGFDFYNCNIIFPNCLLSLHSSNNLHKIKVNTYKKLLKMKIFKPFFFQIYLISILNLL